MVDHSQTLQSTRKDLKAPDSYPKKQQLASMKQIGESIALFAKNVGVVDLDTTASDRYIVALSSKGQACLYDRDPKKVLKKVDKGLKGADIVRIIPGQGDDEDQKAIIAGKSCLPQAWNMSTGQKLFDIPVEDSAATGITGLTFQPLNEFAAFSYGS